MEHSNKSGYEFHKNIKICRGCLSMDTGLNLNILNENLHGIFSSVTGLQIQENDNLTMWLCQQCYMLLCRIRNFRKTAIDTDLILRRYSNIELNDHVASKQYAIDFSPVQSIHACNKCNDCDYNTVKLKSQSHSLEKSFSRNVYCCLGEELETVLDINSVNSNVVHDSSTDDSDTLMSDLKKQKHKCKIGNVRKRKVLAQIKLEKMQKQSKKTKEALKTIGTRMKKNIVPRRDIECIRKFENVNVNDIKQDIFEEFVAVDTLQLPIPSAKVDKKRQSRTSAAQQPNENILKNTTVDTISQFDYDSSKVKEAIYEKLDNTINDIVSEDFTIKVKNRKKKNKASVLDKSKIEVIMLNEDEQISELKTKAEHADFIKALFKCVLCVRSFPYLESYQLHMKRHDKSVGPLKCQICQQYCSNAATMRGHALTHSLRYKCRMCPRIFLHKFTAQRHLLRHDGFFMCKSCPQTFSDRKDYSKHLKTHSTSVEVFGCPMCPKTFQGKWTYNIHIRKHTGALGYPCDHCDSVFASAAARASHSSVHVTTKHFYCAACDASFKTEPKLQYHLRTSPNHVDASYFMFPCDQCARRYATQLKLTAHIDAAHSTHARYACQSCPLLYKSANGLRHHRRKVHEGKRPERKHTCDTCGRSFSNNVILTNHIRTHTGEQPFECPTCSRRFSQKAAMQTHIKLVHLKLKRNTGLKSKKSNIVDVETNLTRNSNCVDFSATESQLS